MALRELGYIESQNIVIEYRYGEGKPKRPSELAAELVRLKVDVILVGGSQTTTAAKQATSTIPIVVGSAGDLVGSGLWPALRDDARAHGYGGELDHQAVDAETRINGVMRQSYNTKKIIWNFGEVLEYLSQDFTFVPGDMIGGGTSAGTAADKFRRGPDGKGPLTGKHRQTKINPMRFPEELKADSTLEKRKIIIVQGSPHISVCKISRNLHLV